MKTNMLNLLEIEGKGLLREEYIHQNQATTAFYWAQSSYCGYCKVDSTDTVF